MRRTTLALLSLAVFACQAAPDRSNDTPGQAAPQAAEPAPTTAPTTGPELVPPKRPQIARKDLLAEDLPPVPTLEQVSATVLASGELSFPDGTDELAPRAALALREGLLLAGQAYHDRRPGTPPQSWRWTGFIPTDGQPRSTLHDAGAIRAAIVDDDSGLLTGTSGTGFDARGWFAKVSPGGMLTDQTTLETPSTTEMFAVLPGQADGQADGERVVLGGYVDSQAWLISLDIDGQRRWEKYIGSYGQTQVRALARLDNGDLLAIGSRGEKFGEAWSALAPGDGGPSAAGDDVTQAKIEIEGADQNRMLRVLVDLGASGYLALGTARRNYFQAHDQLLAVGFDRTGALAWSRVIDGVRVTDIHGVRGHDGAAELLVSVPIDDSPQPATTLALVTVNPGPAVPVLARQLADSVDWTSAGFIEGSAAVELLGYAPSKAGVAWRRLTIVSGG